MNQIFIALALTFFTVVSFAKIENPSKDFYVTCGLKRTALSVDPLSVPFPLEDRTEVEGSQALDTGALNLELVEKTDKQLVYQLENVKLFKDGTPSYKYSVRLVVDLTTYKDSHDNHATVQITGEYIVKLGEKVMNRGSLGSDTAIVYNMDGLPFSFQSQLNGFFKTSKRSYVFACSHG